MNIIDKFKWYIPSGMTSSEATSELYVNAAQFYRHPSKLITLGGLQIALAHIGDTYYRRQFPHSGGIPLAIAAHVRHVTRWR